MNGFHSQQPQQPQPQQTASNNSGWVGFGSNTPQNTSAQNNDFLSGQNQQKNAKSSILGKYHTNPTNEFMTSLPGQNKQMNQMGMGGMNNMNNMNRMNMNGMTQMNQMGMGQ